MKLVLLTAQLSSAAGGMAASVPSLARALEAGTAEQAAADRSTQSYRRPSGGIGSGGRGSGGGGSLGKAAWARTCHGRGSNGVASGLGTLEESGPERSTVLGERAPAALEADGQEGEAQDVVPQDGGAWTGRARNGGAWDGRTPEANLPERDILPPSASPTASWGAPTQVHVLGGRDPLRPGEAARWGTHVAALRRAGPAALHYTPGLAAALVRLAPDVIDVQGLWTYPSLASLRHHRRTGVPYVVTPRGMLDPWALRHSAWKKWLARAAFEAAHLRGAACLRATAEMEAAHFRALGLTNPIAIVPNGVDVPPLGPRRGSRGEELRGDPLRSGAPGSPPRGGGDGHTAAGDPTGLETNISPEDSPCPEGDARHRRLLFLSRIHPKKGLPLLLQSWAALQARHPEWELVIAGPDEGGHTGQMQALARELGLGRVRFTGAVQGAAKEALYRSADLFVLPTHAENFGLVVAEALAQEVPVVTTRHAPWAGLETERCGWWIDLGQQRLTDTLDGAMHRPRAELHAMGARGRSWMARSFGWDGVARQMADVYAWVAGRGPRPDCVEL